MKKIILNLLACCLISLSGYSQTNSYIKTSDKSLGGASGEYFSTIQKTPDNGFILGGTSMSISNTPCDKSQQGRGYWDYWVIKTDSAGNKLWDATFGGSSDDYLYSIAQTSNGDFILGGTSDSPISGDKTENSRGVSDYWVVRIDNSGNKIWDKRFGGTASDELRAVISTSDNCIMLIGYSLSDSSGDKSQDNWSNYSDLWLVKLDSAGNKIWDKRYGGFAEELMDQYSNPSDPIDGGYIHQTKDNGFVIACTSTSGIGGDKSQTYVGWDDLWILKIDSNGVKQWDKTYGGTQGDEMSSLILLQNSGFVLAGRTLSGIGGNKTEPLWGTHSDFWIVKLDSMGNKIWDKDIGGTDYEEEFGNIAETQDGGLLMIGISYSNISGNKTENNSLGAEQNWVVKLDSNGLVQWDKTIYTIDHEEAEGKVIEDGNNCFVVVHMTSASIGGYKSQNTCNGSNDFWMIKFCDSLSLTSTQNISSTSNFQIFPNPTSGLINIELPEMPEPNSLLTIISPLGEIVQQQNVINRLTKINMTLPDGIYFIKLNSSNKSVTKKIIVQHE